jgi:microsomal dipeptidase-like Zn-dependent dipeptidase
MTSFLVFVLVVIAVVVGVLWVVGRRVEAWMNRVKGPAPPPPSEAALQLHRQSVVVDLHADPLLWGRDLAEWGRMGHVDLPRLREGGMTLQVFGLVTQVPLGTSIDRTDPSRPDTITLLALSQAWPARTLRSRMERALYQCRQLTELAERRPDELRIVRTREDLDAVLEARARGGRLVGGLLSVEGAQALDGDPANLKLLYEAGVRMIGLAHFFDNEFAGSAHGLERGGLTPAGETLVREMERLGVVVDLAHASPTTIEDVLRLSSRPPVVSHTGVRGTCDNNRNLSDDQIRAVAETGGVIGIGFWADAVGGTKPADIARAAVHAVEVAGDDHVGLGSDFNGAVATSFDVSQLPVVTQALLDAGLSPTAVHKILGENAIRVVRSCLPTQEGGAGV